MNTYGAAARIDQLNAHTELTSFDDFDKEAALEFLEMTSLKDDDIEEMLDAMYREDRRRLEVCSAINA